jgi:hypothetical protein
VEDGHWNFEGTRLGGRDMEGWRIASSRVLGYRTLGWTFGLSLVLGSRGVGMLLVMHVSSSQDRRRIGLLEFSGVFVVLVSGDGLGRRQITWKSRNSLKNPNNFCVPL